MTLNPTLEYGSHTVGQIRVLGAELTEEIRTDGVDGVKNRLPCSVNGLSPVLELGDHKRVEKVRVYQTRELAASQAANLGLEGRGERLVVAMV